MTHTTHKLTPEQKENLFTTHQELINMIFVFGGFMLRRQIKQLFHLLTDREEMDIEFDISELILSGYLLQKTINRDTRTQMLYLSKYPKSRIMGIENSGNVPAINWTNQKMFEQIFKIEFLIEKVIPAMKKQNYVISIDNITTYLQWCGSNLFLSNNQIDMVTFYNNMWNTFVDNNFEPGNDFFRDVVIAKYDEETYKSIQLKKNNKELPTCKEKIQRDTEMESYKSEIDRNKQYYNLKNFASNGFYVESVKHNIISIYYFDSMNSIQTKKLYQNLCYILLMFQRHLNNYNLHLNATVFTWDQARAEHLHDEENKQAYDFYNQEWADDNKKINTMKSVGLLPSNWNSISVNYKSMDIFDKYNVHL